MDVQIVLTLRLKDQIAFPKRLYEDRNNENEYSDA